MEHSNELPPLPSYQLTPLPSLLPPIPDKLLTLLLPIVAYWGLSMFFHWIDTNDYFPQYRLHTPAEVAKRNRVSRWEVVRDVIIQQVVQTAVGWVLGMTEPDDCFGKEEYDIAVWARRIRVAERAIPGLLAIIGLDTTGLAKNISPSHPMLAGVLMGGQYSSIDLKATGTRSQPTASGFAGWELNLAWAIYWVLVPILQFGVAILVVDTWQYFLHRAMHMNKWLYSRYFHTSAQFCLLLADSQNSHLPFPTPSIVCALCIRSALQPPRRRLFVGHAWCKHCLQACRNEHQTRHGLFRRFDPQNC